MDPLYLETLFLETYSKEKICQVEHQHVLIICLFVHVFILRDIYFVSVYYVLDCELMYMKDTTTNLVELLF